MYIVDPGCLPSKKFSLMFRALVLDVVFCIRMGFYMKAGITTSFVCVGFACSMLQGRGFLAFKGGGSICRELRQIPIAYAPEALKH